ncbi:MAG: molybdenum cofactor guanylyltransferase MobA [Geminicoccaceae bacterium]
MSSVGVILAGGLARRMGGGDKSLKMLGDRPILGHVIARARPQVGALVLNANGNPARFAGFGLPVQADPIAGHAGPLAGVLAGLLWARAHQPAAQWLASFAGDTPFFPTDLVARLRAALEETGADLACAASAGRSHPVFGLWPTRLTEDLQRAVVDDGVRKVDAFTANYRLCTVTFDIEPFDPFFNANRPEDLVEAERLRKQHVCVA